MSLHNAQVHFTTAPMTLRAVLHFSSEGAFLRGSRRLHAIKKPWCVSSHKFHTSKNRANCLQGVQWPWADTGVCLHTKKD